MAGKGGDKPKRGAVEIDDEYDPNEPAVAVVDIDVDEPAPKADANKKRGKQRLALHFPMIAGSGHKQNTKPLRAMEASF